jgi:hypothetical protein
MAEKLRTGAAIVGLLLMAGGGAMLSVPITMIAIGAVLLAGATYGTLRKSA